MQTTVSKPAFIFSALLLVAVAGAFADPLRAYADPLEQQNQLNWLKTMAFAVHQTDYSGTFVYQYDNHVEISRITHISDRDGEHGRLEGLDGARREIIRNNGQVWCYLGDRKMRLEERQGGRGFPELLPEQLSLLNENYLIKEAEEDRVAGFRAHAMIFQPKDSLRYVHKMWVHSDSGLLLKAAVLDERGRTVEQYAFIQLAIGGDIDRSWIPAEDPANPVAHKSQAASASRVEPPGYASGWQVDMLPAGFKKIMEIRRPMRGKKEPVIQIVYSDGLAGISVFIEKADNDADDRPGLSSQGVIQIYSKQIDDRLITVVGEVPPRTVMQVVDSVRYGGSP